MGKALGIISLIFGLLGLLVGWFLEVFLPFLPFARFYLPVVAIVTGIVGVSVQEKKGMAIAGLVLGSVAFVLAIFIFPLIRNLIRNLIEYILISPFLY